METIYFAIDRLEKDAVLLQDDAGSTRAVARGLLPADLREGDVLAWDGTQYRIAPEETARRKQAVQALIDELWDEQT